MKKIYLIILTFTAIYVSMAAEDLQIPYIEGLKASAGESSVTLTWKDSGYSDYTYRVYRSTEIINNNNFNSAEFIGKTVNNNTFIDYPDRTENFYYAVLAADLADNIYKLFIPYNNITTSPVKISSPSSLTEIAAKITDISASSRGNSVSINFTSNKKERTLSIFRSSKPIFDFDSIAGADLLSEINSAETNFTDFPLPGTLYYYAVLDTELYKSGRYSIKPGENSTVNSIGVVTGDTEAYLETRDSIRNKPLPFLEVDTSIGSGKQLTTQSTQLPVKQNLSFKTASIVKNITANIFLEEKESLTPLILPEEMETSDSSEEYQLKKIVLSDFNDRNWSAAYQLLSNFLSVRHSKDIEYRAHFYRGQVLFFQNKLRESFMEFILTSDHLKSEISPWQDQILLRLRGN